jgi:hypothetical protein
MARAKKDHRSLASHANGSPAPDDMGMAHVSEGMGRDAHAPVATLAARSGSALGSSATHAPATAHARAHSSLVRGGGSAPRVGHA